MDWLNVVGSVASVIGLIISIYTLYMVNNLPSALKQQSRNKHLSDLIDQLTKMPKSKATLEDSTIGEISAAIKIVRLYDVSKIPFRHNQLKKVLENLEAELNTQKQTRVVIQHLRLIRDEITIR